MAKKRGSVKGDYRHITKDPVIDVVRTEAQREGWIKGGGFKESDENEKRSIGQLADKAGISDSTLRNWFAGKTRRPQSFTMRLALEALGVRTCYQRADGSFIQGWGAKK